MKKTKALSSKTINPGTKFLTKTNTEFIYLGKHLACVSSYAKDTYKKCIKSMYYVRDTCGAVHALPSLNAFEIIKENDITEADCLKFAKNYKYYATEESVITYNIKPRENYYTKIIKEDTKEIQYIHKYIYSYSYSSYNKNEISSLKKEGYQNGYVYSQLVTGDKTIIL